MIKFLDLQKQYKSIKKEIDTKIFEVIEKSAFVGGEYLTSFEEEFASYCDAKYCIGVGNGTDALEIALWSLDLPKGSEVLVPANTFIATSEAVSRNNLKIKFVDCDENYQISPLSIEKNITKETSAIVVVHLYGHPANMDKILPLIKKHNLKLVEDCAQAHGAKYKNKKVGSFGDIATFSFYPGKNLGAYGDGGAIITNNQELANKCRMYANHGRSSKYGHEFEGVNSRLDSIQAVVLSVKLKYLDNWIKRRQEVANLYLDKLEKIENISLPKVNKDTQPVWHLFVIKVKNRDSLKEKLQKEGIQSGIHYPTALPKLKAYEYLFDEEYLSYKACNEDSLLLSLPMGEHLENKEIDYVVEVLRKNFI
ncbi:DegT/DnrJ/EryC1/StrS family aminotransferase [Halarcobacter sp.]|uniref:DegT/DnrJ/EryC1/StrS family aminotransferase n=1 Tax=Halarcobacter sp. TaxID=2321133 RepID=UPI002AAC0FAA|nr:DegT/DnrJ/EryC1/StrS family aminotransferase [Halarcobacter sp.]